MTRLPRALGDWPGADFAASLKAELAGLGRAALPLEQCIESGSYVGEAPIEVSVLQASDAGDAIAAKLGVFFTEIVASCGCGAEPMEQNGYCELLLRIDKATGQAGFALIDA